ncbi:MAG: amino acid permease [Novosphingobium sp. 17-62-8]|nr:MAG: amino acid permease [Novosphingobium sp. 17-62-8]
MTHAVLYGLGVTIGAGIYVLVGVAAGRSGMNAPIAFMIAALAMGFTAAAFAELGTRMPISASEAAYVEAAFDRKWLGLIVGLLVVVNATITAATISSGSAGYIAVFIDLPSAWIIVGVVLAMGAVACMGTAQSIAFAGVMTLVEIGGLLLIVGAGLMSEDAVLTRLPEMMPAGDPDSWMAIGGTTVIAVFAFIGFEHLVNIAEELKQPSRTLPRALFLTLGITTVLYVLVMWISIVVVPPQELATSPAPLATVFMRLTGFPLVTMSAIAVVATLNGIVVNMIMIARVLYGLSARGSLPVAFARLGVRTRTPLLGTAVGVGAILVLAVAIPLGGLADIAARGTLLIFAITNAALIRIKLRCQPVPAGIFVCPLWVAVAGLTSSLVLLAFAIFE